MFDDLLLTEPVVVALRLAAAARQGDQPLGTTDVVLTLLRNDTTNPWDYVTLHTGDYEQLARRGRPDPDPPIAVTGRWEGVGLTPTLARAFRYAEELGRAYRLLPVPAGLLALALVAEADSGATRTLLDGTGLTHVELVDLVHEHLLDGRLAESPVFPPWNRAREPTLAQASSPAAGATGTTATPRHPATARGGHRARAWRIRSPASLRQSVASPRPPEGLDAGAWLQAAGGPGAYDVLRAAVRLAGDPLRDRLRPLLLDDDHERFTKIERRIAKLSDRSASSVIDRACDRSDTDRPTPAHVIAAATVDASEKVQRLCWFLGVEPREVAALADDLEASDIGGALGGRRARQKGGAAALMITVLLLDLAVTAVVIAHVAQTRQWLHLALAWLAWSGHPGSSVRPGLVVAGLLGWLVHPLVGILHLAGRLVELFWARAERLALWGQTGVRLSLAEHRRHLRRRHGRWARASALRQRATLERRLQAS